VSAGKSLLLRSAAALGEALRKLAATRTARLS
jgi:hypothetical protein